MIKQKMIYILLPKVVENVKKKKSKNNWHWGMAKFLLWPHAIVLRHHNDDPLIQRAVIKTP